MREHESKQDWKLFRKKIGQWQEDYMDRLTKEYIELLSSDEAPSEKFWKLEKRIRQDKKSPGVLIHMSRTDLRFNILALIIDGVISVEDLEGFSDDLRNQIETFLELRARENSDEESDEESE